LGKRGRAKVGKKGVKQKTDGAARQGRMGSMGVDVKGTRLKITKKGEEPRNSLSSRATVGKRRKSLLTDCPDKQSYLPAKNKHAPGQLNEKKKKKGDQTRGNIQGGCKHPYWKEGLATLKSRVGKKRKTGTCRGEGRGENKVKKGRRAELKARSEKVCLCGRPRFGVQVRTEWREPIKNLS